MMDSFVDEMYCWTLKKKPFPVTEVLATTVSKGQRKEKEWKSIFA